MSKKFKQPKPKSTIKAIDKLIKHYKRYAMTAIPVSYGALRGGQCPLCVVHTVKNTLAHNCSACPWGTIDNIYCATIFRSQTTKERLTRLYRWKEKIGGNSCQLK